MKPTSCQEGHSAGPHTALWVALPCPHSTWCFLGIQTLTSERGMRLTTEAMTQKPQAAITGTLALRRSGDVVVRERRERRKIRETEKKCVRFREVNRGRESGREG